MKKLFVVFLFFTRVVFLHAQQNSFAQNLQRFDSLQILKNASWGFCMIDNKSGDLIASHNPNLSLLPASNLKIITTAAALLQFGGDYQLKTILSYQGTISNGVLKGNLVISGAGDPSFGSWRFGSDYKMESILNQWTQAIKSAGIQSIEGNIIIDLSLFGGQAVPDGWTWNDIGNYYGAGAFALNVAENTYYASFSSPKELGAPTKLLEIVPAITGLDIKSEVVTGEKYSGDQVYIYGGPGDFSKEASGTLPRGEGDFSVRGSMPDPPSYFAEEFIKSMAKSGIKLVGAVEEKHEAVAIEHPLAVHSSPKMIDLITETNMKSINLYAECLLKLIGSKNMGYGGTNAGIEVITQMLKSNGFDLDGFYMKDGSGLSRTNAISTRHFAHFLYYISKSKEAEKFKSSLPVSGSSGTMRNICGGTPAEGKIFAKTGTIDRVTAYSGYVNGNSGKTYSFSLIVNNYNGSDWQVRKEIEKLFINLVQDY